MKEIDDKKTILNFIYDEHSYQAMSAAVKVEFLKLEVLIDIRDTLIEIIERSGIHESA